MKADQYFGMTGQYRCPEGWSDRGRSSFNAWVHPVELASGHGNVLLVRRIGTSR